MTERGEKNGSFDLSSVKGLAFKGGKALFLRHVIGFIINFSGGIALARFLGPEVLGLYFISFTLFVILRQLIDFGICTHLIRLPVNPSQAEIKSAFTLQQAIGLVSMALTVFIIAPFGARWYGHSELLFLIGSAGIGAYFYSFHSIPLSKLEREMDYRKVGVIEVSEIIVFNLISVVGAVAGVGIWGLALGNVFRGFVPAFIAAVIAGFRPAFSLERQGISSVANAASPILGSNLVLWIIMLAPPVLVGTLAGTKALGIAQLAYSLLGNTMFIANIFQRVSLTSLSKFQGDPEKFNRAVMQILQLLFIIYIPLTMGVASLSPWWVQLIYGERWAEMDKVMLVAAIPFTSAALLSVLLSALLSKGLTKVVFKQNIVHAVIYWAVMGLIASSYGAISVPLSHLAAMSAGYMFIQAYSRHCGGIDYKPLFLGFSSGTAVMFISWFAAKGGYFAAPLILWPAFVAVFVVLSATARQTVAVFINNIKGI